MLHVLRDCPVANALWIPPVNPSKFMELFSLEHNDWFEACITRDLGADNGMKWGDSFRVAVWLLWKW